MLSYLYRRLHVLADQVHIFHKFAFSHKEWSDCFPQHGLQSPLRFTSTGQSSKFIQPLVSPVLKCQTSKKIHNQRIGKSKHSVPSPLNMVIIPMPLNFSRSSVRWQVLGQLLHCISSFNLYNNPVAWVLPPLSSQETEAQGS